MAGGRMSAAANKPLLDANIQ
eukprot:SAG25_NODE_10695_length_325_cov_0.849558_1_plen_20_part_10